MKAAREFIIRDQDNADYVLFCKSRLRFAGLNLCYPTDSGHAGQHVERDKSIEEDGWKECE